MSSFAMSAALYCTSGGYKSDLFSLWWEDGPDCVAQCPAGADEVQGQCVSPEGAHGREAAMTFHYACSWCDDQTANAIAEHMWLGVAWLLQVPLAELTVAPMMISSSYRVQHELEHFTLHPPSHDPLVTQPGLAGGPYFGYELFVAMRVHSMRIADDNANLRAILTGKGVSGSLIPGLEGVTIFNAAERRVPAISDMAGMSFSFKFQNWPWNAEPDLDASRNPPAPPPAAPASPPPAPTPESAPDDPLDRLHARTTTAVAAVYTSSTAQPSCHHYCQDWMLGDGICDTSCNYEACLYDLHDCDPSYAQGPRTTVRTTLRRTTTTDPRMSVALDRPRVTSLTVQAHNSDEGSGGYSISTNTWKDLGGQQRLMDGQAASVANSDGTAEAMVAIFSGAAAVILLLLWLRYCFACCDYRRALVVSDSPKNSSWYPPPEIHKVQKQQFSHPTHAASNLPEKRASFMSSASTASTGTPDSHRTTNSKSSGGWSPNMRGDEPSYFGTAPNARGSSKGSRSEGKAGANRWKEPKVHPEPADPRPSPSEANATRSSDARRSEARPGAAAPPERTRTASSSSPKAPPMPPNKFSFGGWMPGKASPSRQNGPAPARRRRAASAPPMRTESAQQEADSMALSVMKRLDATLSLPLQERKKIFKELQRELHPDKNIGRAEAAKLAFQQLMDRRNVYLAA